MAGAACTWARSSAVTNTERSKPGSRCMCNCVLRRRNLAHGSGRSVSKKTEHKCAVCHSIFNVCARKSCNRVWLHEVRARANGGERPKAFAKRGEKPPGRVTLQGRESPNRDHHAIFEALAQSIKTTGIPASFEQTQRVPTGHPDVCLCVVSGATNEGPLLPSILTPCKGQTKHRAGIRRIYHRASGQL